MNPASSLTIFISFLVICVRCAFSWSGMFSDMYRKVADIAEYIPCRLTECCTEEYVSPDINSKYIESVVLHFIECVIVIARTCLFCRVR